MSTVLHANNGCSLLRFCQARRSFKRIRSEDHAEDTKRNHRSFLHLRKDRVIDHILIVSSRPIPWQVSHRRLHSEVQRSGEFTVGRLSREDGAILTNRRPRGQVSLPHQFHEGSCSDKAVIASTKAWNLAHHPPTMTADESQDVVSGTNMNKSSHARVIDEKSEDVES